MAPEAEGMGGWPQGKVCYLPSTCESLSSNIDNRERKKKEFVENKKKWDAQKEREMGRKIFVGGFKFNDLTEAGEEL